MKKVKSRNLITTTITAILLVMSIGGCKDENVETVGVCPIVVSTNPSNLSDGIALDKIITVTFNEGMDPSTITSDAFTLSGTSGGRVDASTNNSEILSGSLTYDSATFTMSFAPNSKPQANTTYTGTVGTSVKDPMGNALQTPYIWSFRTGATVSPNIISTDPPNEATGVVLNKMITATFNVAMDPLTITSETFSLMNGTTPVSGVVSGIGPTAFFTPSAQLLANTFYTATIRNGAKNLQGTTLSNDYVWTFTTGTVIAPSVISIDPVNLATGVPLHKVVSATFSEAMDPSTINASSFILKVGDVVVSGEVNYSERTVTFTPTSNCFSCTNYTAVLTTTAKNLAGISLANDYVWTFTTNY